MRQSPLRFADVAAQPFGCPGVAKRVLLTKSPTTAALGALLTHAPCFFQGIGEDAQTDEVDGAIRLALLVGCLGEG